MQYYEDFLDLLEPKKRRFHPLRGLRKIFRRKSRGAADVRLVTNADREAELVRVPREEITDRHPAGRPEEARSRSASELLTDSCDRESVFLRRTGTIEDSFVKLRGGAGKLSVSHDSVFPGEVPHTRPLSSLASLATLEVLEQIKTVIENQNQLVSAASSDSASVVHNRFGHEKQERKEEEENQAKDKGSARCSTRIEDRQRSKPETRQRIPPLIKDAIPRIEEEVIEGSKSPKDTVDRVVPVAKEDLPELESASLSHTAAHHRISVRPKNRRPPRRSGSQVASTPTSTITTIAEDSLDSLQTASANNSNASTPTEPKNVSIGRKSSNRLSRTSDIFEELEAKLPRKPPSVASLSPDSLDAVEMNDEQESRGSIARKSSNRTPKNTEMFEELETKLPRRRSASNRSSKSPDSLEAANGWFSKSTEGFEKLMEYEEVKPVTRRLLGPISKSTDRVSKSSDSLEAIEALTSDESIERRRSSFELRARRSSKKMSKSSESFEMLEQIGTEGVVQELQKRSSISDMNLSRGRRLSKSISKSSEDFERIEISESKEEDARESLGKCSRRSSKRMSSESSDNLDSEDRLENRRMRRAPKRIPSTSYVDIVPMDDQEEEKRAVTGQRKPCRLQKSSESSELGSTDTLDSERRNKSSESTETLDSLERDLDQDRKQEDLTDTVADRREKNDPWTNKSLMMSHSDQMADNNTEDSKPLISPDKFYWRQSSESKENIDIHQLLAITIVTRMADNGNNQRSSVIYPKKKQQITTSQPTSPVAKQEDNKMIFDNLLVSKNDEDLQNMLNGNISEVSTDTKSFKEKLIMFEKLGK
ncbi:otolith matrix protein OMM-64 isoform X5 [Apis cerana]|uniref:otolith matrix protein OMM-64 isoform X5 n=1 Tax=Apis cerana TaxID=7461 RepID=UPI002B222954|nr:otolith matrix protein OMM-64 isoform X5 [Apis cerana]